MPGEGVAPTAGTAEPAPADVVELLATGEDLDVASEDPGFYTWLADRGLPETNGTG